MAQSRSFGFFSTADRLSSILRRRQPSRFNPPPPRSPGRPTPGPRRAVTAWSLSAVFSSLAKKLMGDGPEGESASEAEQITSALFFADNAPSWEDLARMVEEMRQKLGVPEVDPKTGSPSPEALERLFGTDKETVRVKLYRDHAAWCPYCQKIWIQLEEKEVPYIVEKINMRCYGDKPPAFLKLTPSGLLPVIELDGRVIKESAEIAEALEREFPEKPLYPNTAEGKKKAEELMRLERRLFSAWLQWLCSDGWGQQGMKKGFESVLDAVDVALARGSSGPYFMGKEFSIVDIVYAPFLERQVASLAYYKGFRMRGEGKWPALERWFEAMESRPTYLASRSDFYTHAHALPPQLGGCGMVDEGKPLADAIDGRDGKSWKLPLEPLSGTSLEPYTPGDNPPVDRLELAYRLVRNHENVVKFGLRAVGKAGDRPVTAPLSDPTAVPGMEYQKEVDCAFRHVAHALLVGVEEKQSSEQLLKVSTEQGDGYLDGLPVVYSSKYVCDRVGVPRDMKFTEARQLRAHMNWIVDTLKK